MNREHSREMYLPGGTCLYLKREKAWEPKGIPCFVKLETLVLLSSVRNLLNIPKNEQSISSPLCLQGDGRARSATSLSCINAGLVLELLTYRAPSHGRDYICFSYYHSRGKNLGKRKLRHLFICFK